MIERRILDGSFKLACSWIHSRIGATRGTMYSAGKHVESGDRGSILGAGAKKDEQAEGGCAYWTLGNFLSPWLVRSYIA
jgi:hypothetical protein